MHQAPRLEPPPQGTTGHSVPTQPVACRGHCARLVAASPDGRRTHRVAQGRPSRQRLARRQEKIVLGTHAAAALGAGVGRWGRVGPTQEVAILLAQVA
eukprot:1717628-Pyramimonas_sp.AAC.1